MNNEMVKDILIKASEDVQQGMLCSSTWFEINGDNSQQEWINIDDLYNMFEDRQVEVHRFDGTVILHDAELGAKLSTMERCAEGSLALATFLLGGVYDDFKDAIEVADAVLDDRCELCKSESGRTVIGVDHVRIYNHNDSHMDINEKTQFAAGQEWAEVFRAGADRL